VIAMLPNNDLSFQLWSAARSADSLEQQLLHLKSFGYTDVQPYHTQYDDPKGMKRLIDEIGLTAKTGHFDLSMFEDEFDRVDAAATLLGMGLLVAAYIQPSERPTDVAGWQRFGRRLQGYASRCEAQGFRFAWHNHEFEFERLPDGSYPIEHLLGEHLLWEVDVAWVLRAKDVDPKPWLARYARRIPAVHVKDIAPQKAIVTEGGWADVGEGIVDWPTLWAASVAAGSQLMIAEHDEPDDYVRFARVSAAAMKRLAGVA
jgi:sugar phosphate isomerase/epimerase